jgi:beta-galactosidase
MKKVILSIIVLTGAFLHPAQAQYRFDNILYGAAYYHEYMLSERLDEDVRMMKAKKSAIRLHRERNCFREKK